MGDDMFIPDFDWLALSPDPGPERWVRPWQWLARMRDDMNLEELRRYGRQVQSRGLEPQFGITPDSGEGLTALPIPWDMAVEEIVQQMLVFEHAGVFWRISSTSEPVDDTGPLARTVAFVSLSRQSSEQTTRWCAGGRPTVGALDAGARWTDRMAVMAPAEALEWVRRREQPLFLVWSPGPGHGQLEVRDEQDRVLHMTHARVTRAVRTCPLVANAVPGQLCRTYGGGWTSRAIVALGRWSRVRWLRLRDVGCDTCGDGQVRVGPKDGQRLLILREYEPSGCGLVSDSSDWEVLDQIGEPSPSRYADVLAHRYCDSS